MLRNKAHGFSVNKVEVIDDSIKFFVMKGVLKSHLVVVKEIPIDEITNIENFGKKLRVTWKGVTYTFFVKGNAESLRKFLTEVNGKLEEQRNSLENNKKVALRRKELLGIINASTDIIDLLFNILFCLQEKRINWGRLEVYSKGFGENLGFTAQTIPLFNLDFLKISTTVKTQIPKEVAMESNNILKAIYDYFDDLPLEDNLKESVPNFQNAKAIILSYYAINDLILGNVVGDKENRKENHQLESVLQILANNSKFRVNIDELRSSLDKLIPENDMESVIGASRRIFKEELKRL